MFATPLDAMREEPLKALGTTIGVLVIMVLLYAIGAVAQGQVRRAAERETQAVSQQSEQARCLRSELRVAGCDGLQTAKASAQVPVHGALYVAYR